MKAWKRVKNKKKKKKKRLLSSERVPKNEKGEWWESPWSINHEWVQTWERMNNLLFHMDDTTMMRTRWDEKANLGLESLSNQCWKDERPSFCYPLLQWEIVSTC